MSNKNHWTQDWTKHSLAPYIWMCIGGLLTSMSYLLIILLYSI
jgi:hypothetical protein